MAGTRDFQNAFNGGEISPTMLGRTDVAAYQSGLRTSENWILLKPGGLERRPGTLLVSELYNETIPSRLIRFHVSQDDSFALEFSEYVFRVFKNGSVLILADWQLDAVAAVDPNSDELIIPNHGFYASAGPFRLETVGTGTLPAGLAAGTDYWIDLPQIANITAIDLATETFTAVNTYTAGQGPFRMRTTGQLPTGIDDATAYYIRTPTATTFQLSLTVGGAPVNITGLGTGNHTLVPEPSFTRGRCRLKLSPTTTSIVPIGGTGTGFMNLVAQGIYPARFTHPYTRDQLFDLDHAQSGDIMYLALRQRSPTRLTRHSNQQWSVEEVELYDGPYLLDQETFPGEADPSVQINPSHTSGQGRTVTATKAIFLGTDVGRSLRYTTAGSPLKWGWAKITGVNPLTFVDADYGSITIAPARWNAGADEVQLLSAHNMLDGEPIKFTLTLGGVNAAQQYYAHVLTVNNFSVHNTEADALADVNRVNLTAIGVNQTVVHGYLTKTAHGLTGRSGPVTLTTTGTLPPGLALFTSYWLEAVDANRLILRLTPGGTPVTPDALTGTGTHQVNGTTLPSATCTIDIKEQFVGTGNSSLWRLGAFGAHEDLLYPKAVCFHEQRLVFGGTEGEPQTLYFSTSGDFENFAPDEDDGTGDHVVTKASGMVIAIGADVASRILWLSPLGALVVGCLDGPWVIQTPLTEALSAADLPTTLRQAKVGIGEAKPVSKGTALLFTSHSPGYAYAASFNVDANAIVPNELMVMASHLADGGDLIQLADSGPPLDVIWFVRADGELLALTLDPQQEITAWGRFRFGAGSAGDAVVESCCTTGNRQDGEQLWVTVRRTINGVTRRYLEVMAPRFRTTDLAETAHFVDSGLDLTLSPASTTVPGLDHLEGETVSILADGRVVEPRVVTGGQIELDEAATRVHVGLAYLSVAETLPAELPVRYGQNIQMLQKRFVRAMLRVHRSLNLEVGPSRSELRIMDLARLPSDPMGQAVPLYTGVVEMPSGGSWERDGSFAFGSQSPCPLQVLAVMGRLEWSDR